MALKPGESITVGGYNCGHYQPQGTADWQCAMCGMWYPGHVGQTYPGGQGGPLCPGCVRSVSGDSGSVVYPQALEVTLTTDALRHRHAVELEMERDALRAEVERLRERVAELEAESEAWEKASVVRMVRRVQELEAMLRRLEWITWATITGYVTLEHCPICHRHEDRGHAPGCELAAILAESEG